MNLWLKETLDKIAKNPKIDPRPVEKVMERKFIN